MSNLIIWGSALTTSKVYKRGFCGKILDLLPYVCADVNLIVEILSSAGKDKDINWINSNKCKCYCELINLSHKKLLEILEETYTILERHK